MGDGQPQSGKLKIFVSWSGDRAKLLASALRDWLPMIDKDFTPWISRQIEAGASWRDVIMRELRDTDIGIVCLTPENLESRWLNFEAGALAKRVEESRVIPLLHPSMKHKDVGDPLEAYQWKHATKDGIWEVVVTLNGKLSDPRTEPVLRQTFELWFPNLQTKLAEIPSNPPVVTASPEKSVQEMFEELMESNRSMDRRLAVVAQNMPMRNSFGYNVGAFGTPPAPTTWGYIDSMRGDFFLSALKAAEGYDQGQKVSASELADNLEDLAKKIREKDKPKSVGSGAKLPPDDVA